MKRTIYRLLTVLTLALIMPSCYQNDGDIGIWYGLWKVESVTNADGSDYRPWAESRFTMYFAFQSSVFNIKIATDHGLFDSQFGAWEEADGHLTVEFPDKDSKPFSFSGLAPDAPNVFTIVNTSSSRMELDLTQPDGNILHYILAKW